MNSLFIRRQRLGWTNCHPPRVEGETRKPIAPGPPRTPSSSMADRLSASSRSELMARVRQSGTAPELRVRKALTTLGARYRLKSSRIKQRPDIVFPGSKVAIYVHGCFWHQHPGCPAARIPKTRAEEYWGPKLAANVARDARHEAALRAAGWEVFTIWECQTRAGGTLDVTLAAVVKAVEKGRPRSR